MRSPTCHHRCSVRTEEKKKRLSQLGRLLGTFQSAQPPTSCIFFFFFFWSCDTSKGRLDPPHPPPHPARGQTTTLSDSTRFNPFAWQVRELAGANCGPGKGEERTRREEKREKGQKDIQKEPYSIGANQRVTTGERQAESRYRIISAPSIRCDQPAFPQQDAQLNAAEQEASITLETNPPTLANQSYDRG